ncbi:hypothetical protein SAMN05421749_101356 [Acinetobacter marinus]|uniref:Uncharacterized protein n=1 Tax=Acinetobacter marinus TaxID=281375 RepID=A0A1G6GSJ5_9GAMM|nr:hypothetical protein SAMN05421749_101356 [Acinetobacter marinus]
MSFDTKEKGMKSDLMPFSEATCAVGNGEYYK